MLRSSVLDLSPIIEGGSAAQAFRNTVDLAQHAEQWGYHRYWLAEHHNLPGIASAATAVVIGQVAGATERIRVGAGGIMLPNHAPLVIAEQFGTLEALFPGRIDLGLGRAPGSDQATARALRRNLGSNGDSFPEDLAELQSYFHAPAHARRRGKVRMTFPASAPRCAAMLSFIVPAYNEEHELPATLRAIQEAAEVAQQDYEIIVVNDASTDATEEIARSFGAHVVAVQLRQIAAVRNAGARAAQGQVLCFVDADTRISAVHVTGAVQALKSGFAGGSARVALEGAVPFWARLFLGAFSAVYFTMKLGVGAFLFAQREAFEAVGGFDEQYFAGEEAYLSMALKTQGRFKILREPIMTSGRKIRMHPANFVLGQSFFIFFGGPNSLRNRKRLDLWYDGKRERNPV